MYSTSRIKKKGVVREISPYKFNRNNKRLNLTIFFAYLKDFFKRFSLIASLLPYMSGRSAYSRRQSLFHRWFLGILLHKLCNRNARRRRCLVQWRLLSAQRNAWKGWCIILCLLGLIQRFFFLFRLFAVLCVWLYSFLLVVVGMGKLGLGLLLFLLFFWIGLLCCIRVRVLHRVWLVCRSVRSQRLAHWCCWFVIGLALLFWYEGVVRCF